MFGLIILLCGQVVSIGGRNHPVSHPKYVTHQTSPGNIYVQKLFIMMQRNEIVINRDKL